jgi:hypothetical protein
MAVMRRKQGANFAHISLMTERCKCGHEKSRHELGSGRCGHGLGMSADSGLAPCTCQAFRPAEKPKQK